MRCSGCDKEIERAASGYGSNWGGEKVFCDTCTDSHPDGVMKRMERAMQLRMPDVLCPGEDTTRPRWRCVPLQIVEHWSS